MAEKQYRIVGARGGRQEFDTLLPALRAWRQLKTGRFEKRDYRGEWLLLAHGRTKRSATAIAANGSKVKVWI